ncbi:MAG: hypothetical protein B6D41_08015 [Chloroflexi bacterium UTCFX4]|jgi:3-methyladenine DNA glycosylase/8-oxoguanine DNA glycosylase|nr:MAG: hypothetical protein B6D41_08015 [Chloroflexi bacterium UTCFX4]
MSVSNLETSDAIVHAQALVERALHSQSAKRHYGVDQTLTALRRGENTAWRELKLELARNIAEFLGFFVQDVQAVYVADAVDSYRHELAENPPRRMIHLVIFANVKTAALKALVNALERALGAAVSEYVGGAVNEYSLQVQLVDSADLEQLARYAALLTAPSQRPTCVWEREPVGAAKSIAPQ